jgi:hypothetical protein
MKSKARALRAIATETRRQKRLTKLLHRRAFCAISNRYGCWLSEATPMYSGLSNLLKSLSGTAEIRVYAELGINTLMPSPG